MDIMHDRAGYYLCWGCLNWITAIYTSPALYLAAHRITLGTPLALALLTLGAAAIYINYDADRQRQVSNQNLLSDAEFPFVYARCHLYQLRNHGLSVGLATIEQVLPTMPLPGQ